MIYLDNASTTAPDPGVVESMLPYLKNRFGNPSSPHKLGKDAKEAIENAREKIASFIQADPEEIIFTGSGTEANNMAMIGLNLPIVTSQIEHESILETGKLIPNTKFIGVDNWGYIKDNYGEKINNNLVSIIHTNNEIGTIQDLGKISKICKENNSILHSDACQAKTSINVKRLGIDLLTLNAHKIHGPKGIGALYVKQGTVIKPIIRGGGHEFGYRSGTENVAGIIGFAKAVEQIKGLDINKIQNLKNLLVKKILEISGTKCNSPNKGCCAIANIMFKGIQGDSIVAYLDEHDIAASVGSACATTKLEPSHVLKAIGLSTPDALSSVRFSLSKFTTKDEINQVTEILPSIIEKLRRLR